MTDHQLTEQQIKKFKSILNKAINVLIDKRNLPEDQVPLLEKDDYRLIAGVLGLEGTALEVEAYLLLEQKKWQYDPRRKQFIEDFLAVVRREIILLEMVTDAASLATKLETLPPQITVVNANPGESDSQMPMADFISILGSEPSVFKR